MNIRRASAAALAAVLSLIAVPGQTACEDAQSALVALEKRWSTIRDYQVDIQEHEIAGRKVEDHLLHYSLTRDPEAARITVLAGSDRGSAVIWRGGDRVTVFHGGFLSFAKLSFNMNDRMVTSVRGNTLLGAHPGLVLQCFAAHREALSLSDGPRIDGKPTQAIVMNRQNGITCPNEPALDREVTRDVLIVSPETELPVERIRYAGETIVERSRLSNVVVNAGLHASDFH